MKKIKDLLNYFSKRELILWFCSVLFITVFFCVFDRESYLTLAASIVGATALIFNAKGNPMGPFLLIVFSILYGIISFGFAYYGEMITFLGMSAPMSLFSLISWLKNPYSKGKVEVKVNRLKSKEIIFIFVLTLFMTVAFYFILKAFNTANLIMSTLSVSTSFFAVCLTFRRSVFFPLAYAVNDVVLIIMWIMAAITDISYVSVIVCFIVFLINDMNGFFSWLRMQKRQEN